MTLCSRFGGGSASEGMNSMNPKRPGRHASIKVKKEPKLSHTRAPANLSPIEW